MEKKETSVQNLINEQIAEETYSYNIYYKMYCWALNLGLQGISQWLKKAAEEELKHANILTKYLGDRKYNITYTLKENDDSLDKIDGMTVTEIFQEVLKHEQYITSKLQIIYTTSCDNEDFLSYQVIGDLLKEQIEEEAKALNILDIIKNMDVENNKSSLFILDNYLEKK